jgi:hypothetical protein
MRDDGCYIAPATKEHAGALIPRVPPEDNEDMLRGWGMTSADALMPLCGNADTWTVFAFGEPAAMFGCLPDGAVWLIRGDNLASVSIRFIRHAGPVIDEWVRRYGRVYCHFSVRYKKLLRWLLWEGFEMTDLGNGYVRCEKCAFL